MVNDAWNTEVFANLKTKAIFEKVKIFQYRNTEKNGNFPFWSDISVGKVANFESLNFLQLKSKAPTQAKGFTLSEI